MQMDLIIDGIKGQEIGSGRNIQLLQHCRRMLPVDAKYPRRFIFVNQPGGFIRNHRYSLVRNYGGQSFRLIFGWWQFWQAMTKTILLPTAATGGINDQQNQERKYDQYL
jgi:hypothetical protein